MNDKMCFPRIFLILFAVLTCAARAQQPTRGIGVYPGAPEECFAPRLVQDNVLRNVALHRMARHSSSLDYNLTAQLLTDGIVSGHEPARLEVLTPQGPLPKRVREHSIDGGQYTRNLLEGSNSFMEFRFHQYSPRFRRMEVVYEVVYDESKARGGATFSLLAGKERHLLGKVRSEGLPGQLKSKKAHSDPNKQTDIPSLPVRAGTITFLLDEQTEADCVRLQLEMPGAAYWYVYAVRFFDNDGHLVDVLPSQHFSSVWMAEGGEQWVSIDLGAQVQMEQVKLHWVHPARKGEVQVSDDGKLWRHAAFLSERNAQKETLAVRTSAQYVRILLQQPDESGIYALSEIEVLGRGGLHAEAAAESGMKNGRLWLNGGPWRLARAAEGMPSGERLSQADLDDSQWLRATVPGTVLTSYVNLGAVPNPIYSDDNLQISESYFSNASFWYRRAFTMPKEWVGKRVFLNLDGINWKANVFLNGQRVGRLEGAFMRGQFDITQALQTGQNVLAIEIEPNAHFGAVKEKDASDPDKNGGSLGLDNPTFHASIGWDWNATVRGRNMGIWDDVYLSAARAVTVSDPLVDTRLALPDTAANLTPSAFLKNHEAAKVEGILRGWVGGVRFEQRVALQPNEEREIRFLPEDFPQLRNVRLPLWWPNGYGSPYLHEAGFVFEQRGGLSEKTSGVSDSVCFLVGLRQVDCVDKMSRLRLLVNGKRIVPLGGNWGFSEMYLNYRAREYDAAVRYHRDQHFTMIRNWVGQTGDAEFYEACDRYGILVWQDFWLANPADGPDPENADMFLKNSWDYLRRIRHHACLALYCGRNEGYPPQEINDALPRYIATLHPGMEYIPSSADDGVSGHGPYRALPSREYFQRITPLFHTERGMPCMLTWDGLARTLREDEWWPQGHVWGQHDFTLQGAQRCATFNELVEQAFGKPVSARQFAQWAQWINFNGYRAMFESNHVTRSGLLLWMSHPAWPSMAFQTYDYYLEPTAAYFACKHACEPIHIQWNAVTDSVQVVNRSLQLSGGAQAEAVMTDLQGHELWRKAMAVVLGEDMTRNCFLLERPAAMPSIAILRLRLTGGGRLLSQNDYLLAKKDEEPLGLNSVGKARLEVTTQMGSSSACVTLSNPSDMTALLVRLNLKAGDGEQVLPVLYSDNYFHLLPGEAREVQIEWNPRDVRSGRPKVEVEYLNQ